MKNKKIAYFFWLCCIAHIILGMAGFTLIQTVTKPLLMPCLMLLLLRETDFSKNKNTLLLQTGLFFGWLGDVLLLFENFRPIFFILGLVSFLCGHLFYICYFKQVASMFVRTKKYKPFFILPVVIYTALLLYLLFPSLGPLKIPVTVYAVVLSAMLGVALWLYYTIDEGALWLFVAGAACFVMSHSVLAINKFYHSFFLAGVIIMGTYCAAQYLIVRGAIRVYKNKPDIKDKAQAILSGL